MELPLRARCVQEPGRWLVPFQSCAARSNCTNSVMSIDTGDSRPCSQSTVELNDTDIPGAHLDEPFEAHNVAALHWWLLCRGIKVPTSLRKPQIIAMYNINGNNP